MLVLTAHGTRDPAGARVVERIAARVRDRGVAVEVAYADVRAPDLTTVLRRVCGPAVVVPAFLASGYHVRTDIPAQVAASGHPDVTVTAAFGAAPELVGALHDRLRGAGHREGDAVVLAAAGSSDPAARAEVTRAAAALARRLGTPVRVGYAATARPTVSDAVRTARARSAPGTRVAVASWLLAPGLFHRVVTASGADRVAAPLGDHPAIPALILRHATTPASRHPRPASCHPGPAS